MARMHKRILLTLAIGLLGSLALSAAAQAAPGTVTVYDYGSSKTIMYTGTADPDQVTFGGSLTDKSVTISQAGIADPGPGADPGNDCALTAPDTLTCQDGEIGADFRAGGVAHMGASGDTTTAVGTQTWAVYGEDGEDHLTGSEGGDDELYGGPENDLLETGGSSDRPWYGNRAEGGPGNDVLRGGPDSDSLDGGDGTDDLDGGGGSDSLYGGDGVDTLRAGSGDDYLDPERGDGEVAEGGDGSDSFDCLGDATETYDGGAGFDSVECGGGIDDGTTWYPDNYTIDLAAGVVKRTNHVATTSTLRSVEDAETYDGDDVLIGTDGANSLYAGRGDDSIDGRGGTDYIWGAEGKDTIETADGGPDRADAGADADTCHGDQIDELFGCEALTLAPGPSGTPALDGSAPNCTLVRVRGSRSKGLVDIRATCDETAALGAEAIGRLKRPTRGALASRRAGDVTLGTAAGRAAANASTRVVVRVSKRYRRALPKGARIRVELHATDAAGNESDVTRRVRMR